MSSPTSDEAARSSLVYVYAVAAEAAGARLEGIDGRPVRWLAEAGLAAAVSDVPGEDFDEEPLNEHIRDMNWLAPRAVAHQEVNERLHAAGEATIPLAFGTVFRDEAGVRQLLVREVSVFSERLAVVRGSAEWVVALHVVQEPDADTVAQASPAIQAAQQEIASASPGRAHLLSRRLAALERDERRRLQFEAADALQARLQAIARAVFAEPLPSDTLERPLVRTSVLVAREREAAFLEEIERLRQRWPEPTYRLLLTGPWPPYRFGGLAVRAAGEHDG